MLYPGVGICISARDLLGSVFAFRSIFQQTVRTRMMILGQHLLLDEAI